MLAKLENLNVKSEECFSIALSLIQEPQARDVIRRRAFEALEVDPSEDRWRILLAWSCHLDELHNFAVAELKKLNLQHYGATLEELLVQLGVGSDMSINV